MSQLQGIGLGFAGLGAVNSAVSGLGQYESGQQQKSAYDYNADVTLIQTEQQEQTIEAKNSQLIGKQASAYASAGVDIASGSPLLISILRSRIGFIGHLLLFGFFLFLFGLHSLLLAFSSGG